MSLFTNLVDPLHIVTGKKHKKNNKNQPPPPPQNGMNPFGGQGMSGPQGMMGGQGGFGGFGGPGQAGGNQQHFAGAGKSVFNHNNADRNRDGKIDGADYKRQGSIFRR